MQTEMMTCEEVVATGRYPYTGRFGILSKEDYRSVEEAMELVAKIGKYLIPMIALGVISLVVFGAAVTGIVFFAKGIKNISLEDCKYDISAKNVRIAAYANVGIIILYAIMAISFITSIIYY